MKRITYISSLLISLSGFAQTNLDSLWSIWNSPESTTEQRLEAMNNIAFDGYIYTNPDSAYLLAQMEYDLARKEGNKKYEAKALNTQGTTFYFKSDYAKAIDCYSKALTIQEAIGDGKGQASTMNNMGAIYSDQRELDKALEWYEKSLQIRESLQDKEGMAASYNNIGAIRADKGEYGNAIDYYSRSLKIREEMHDKGGIATSYNNIGKIYSYMKNNRKAGEYYEKGLKIREEIGDKRGLVMSMYNLALNYSQTGNLPAAIEYGERGLKIAKEIKSVLHQSYLTAGLYEDYKDAGQYKKALEMHLLNVRLEDSINSENNQKEILKQEMQYNYEKQKALDEKEHEKKIALAAEQEAKQRTLIYFIGAGLILVLLFAFFIYNRLQLTRKQKILIENQKHLVEEKQKEILDSITYAKRLQDAILPTESAVRALFPESFILYQPKDIVAGDFYWMEVVSLESVASSLETDPKFSSVSELRTADSQLVLLAAADCTGHGVPGAMVSVVCSNALNRAVKEFGITDPGKILNKTGELVLEDLSKSDTEVKDGMDISLVSVNRTTNEIYWAGARLPLWYISRGQLKEVLPDDHSIGEKNHNGFRTHKLGLLKGDLVLLFTDGYADQPGGADGKAPGSSILKEILLRNAEAAPEMIRQELRTAFLRWKGNIEQTDDLCIIGIRI